MGKKDRTKMKFSLPNAACKATASKRFVFTTGNFIIETTTNTSNERIRMYNRSESTSPLKQLPLALVYCSHSTYQVLPFLYHQSCLETGAIYQHVYLQYCSINASLEVQAAKAKNEKQ